MPGRSVREVTRPRREAPTRSGTAPLVAAVVLAALGAGAVVPTTVDSVRGTYRLHGTAHAALGPVLDREVELHADAILERGDVSRTVRVHLAAEGYGCDLLARLDAAGSLSFEGGQRCVVTITSPDARGHLEALLRSGRGRVEGDHLALDLSGDVEGALSHRTGGVRVLGQEIPATWSPELPVRGAVRATAEGDVDRSRAAQR